MVIRTKFKVVEHKLTVDGASIKLAPVTGGSPENESFFKWTPCGEINIGIIDPKTAQQFTPGRTFYVDFSPTQAPNDTFWPKTSCRCPGDHTNGIHPTVGA